MNSLGPHIDAQYDVANVHIVLGFHSYVYNFDAVGHGFLPGPLKIGTGFIFLHQGRWGELRFIPIELANHNFFVFFTDGGNAGSFQEDELTPFSVLRVLTI